MSNETWNVPHAMATAQANEPEALTRAFPDAGEGHMLIQWNRI